jgi:hypothetical protein
MQFTGLYRIHFPKTADKGVLLITQHCRHDHRNLKLQTPHNHFLFCRYTRENHNSVLGIREYTLSHGSRFQAVEKDWVEEWLSGQKESDKFVHPEGGTQGKPTMSLFAFPAEENFSGGFYPLRWIHEVQVRAAVTLVRGVRRPSWSLASLPKSGALNQFMPPPSIGE